jgi:hypothetical protein
VGRTIASPIQTAPSSDVQVQSTIQKIDQKIERERNQRLVIARSWVVLFSVIAAIGVGLGSMAQLHIDPFVASVLGLVAGLLIGRILAFFVGIGMSAAQSRRVTPAIIVTIKVVAFGIAIALISLLIYDYGFNEWVAIGLGVVAYIVAKAILSIALGYVWGRQEAREIKEFFANQPPQVKRDIIDAAPPDIKQRVADAINKN